MPSKQGLSYYSVDTDRYQDIRIKRLKKDFGPTGIAVYDYLLCEIYRVKGSYLVWDEAMIFDTADYFAIDENLVKNIVDHCCNVGLFDAEKCRFMVSLTSKSIQKRYIEMSKRAKRTDIFVPKNLQLTEEQPQLPEVDGQLPEVEPFLRVVHAKGKDSKVKESKEKESIEWPTAANAAPHSDLILSSLQQKQQQKNNRQNQFYNDIAAYIKVYDSQMLREFYDYWREPNKSGTKMRWEMERTWDLGRRLEKWSRNELKWKTEKTQTNEPNINDILKKS
jgi:hypothetical protein